jgi:hypothetical protein
MKFFSSVEIPAQVQSGAAIPVVAIRAVFALVGVLLSFDVCGLSGWAVVGIVFAIVAAIAPQYLLGWGLIVFLAVGQLAHREGLSLRFLLLLAGLHLLHALALWILELPWRSRARPAVFAHGLIRFLAIQVPVQLLAVLFLLLLAPSASGHRPLTIAVCAVVGAAALVGLAVRVVSSFGGEGRPTP